MRFKFSSFQIVDVTEKFIQKFYKFSFSVVFYFLFKMNYIFNFIIFCIAACYYLFLKWLFSF